MTRRDARRRDGGPRIFTLAEARAVLPRLKEVTRRYHDEVEDLRARLVAASTDAERDRLETEAEGLLHEWCAEVAALGGQPKGLWLVDFDSGDGFYFCWRYGEEAIEHVHAYDAGFAGRRFIGSGD